VRDVMPDTVGAASRKRVGVWLATCALLVLAMIVIGGTTRVTRSGLSITTWDPVTGALPPMSARAWSDAFARYQASPEGRFVNAGISLSQFQSIYWVEWAHRLLGRLVGVVVAVPLVVFLVRRELSVRRALPLVALFLAGAAQGVLGWYMVASGLVDEPHVSPFRLASHLLLGMTLFAWLAWSAHGELAPPRTAWGGSARRWAIATLVVLGATVAYGGLMAGHHAGLFAPTFPTMNGAWLPADVHLGSTGALLTDGLTIHFVHRALALTTTFMVIATARAAWRYRSTRVRATALVALGVVALQLTLGALLVVHFVPPTLAVLHQANAALLVAAVVAILREVTPDVARDISQSGRPSTTQESALKWPSSRAAKSAAPLTTRSRAR
jgi:cytochrome c oxidase assembly protein subunit 15